MKEFPIHPDARIIYNGEEFLSDQLIILLRRIHNLLTSYPLSGPIGIYLPRGIEQILSFLTALQIGIPYVPLSLADPSTRLNEIVATCGIQYILTSKSLAENIDVHKKIIIDGTNVPPSGVENNPVSKSDIAYILFTSGSGGTPKGVVISRAALHSFIAAMQPVVNFGAKQRILCATSYTFDIFFVESVMPLLFGLTVVMANDEEYSNPRRLGQLIQNTGINIVQFTPSRLIQLYMADRNLLSLRCIHTLLVGGENYPQWMLEKTQLLLPARILNLYGPTEATIWASASDLSTASVVNIGKPLNNTTLYITDSHLHRLEPGHIGEICIGGISLAEGYVGRSDLTAERFIQAPWGERVYKTGDMGFQNQSGDFFYCGRNDNQVKLRGHRIELEEIEKAIYSVPGVTSCVACIIDKDSPSLAVVYTTTSNINSERFICDKISKRLPQYMMPQFVKQLNELPLNKSGKVSRAACVEILEEIFIQKTYR